MTPITTNSYSSLLRGFSLIEVLVALLVLSIGLLGLAALQTTSLQFNTGSYYRTQATLLAYDIIDRMRANGSAAIDGGIYDVPTTAAMNTAHGTYGSCKGSSCGCDTTACASADMATYDIGSWYDRVVATLPDAQTNPPTIQIDASKQVTITIRWLERDMSWTQSWIVQL